MSDYNSIIITYGIELAEELYNLLKGRVRELENLDTNSRSKIALGAVINLSGYILHNILLQENAYKEQDFYNDIHLCLTNIRDASSDDH
jgi:hypothetical protein